MRYWFVQQEAVFNVINTLQLYKKNYIKNHKYVSKIDKEDSMCEAAWEVSNLEQGVLPESQPNTRLIQNNVIRVRSDVSKTASNDFCLYVGENHQGWGSVWADKVPSTVRAAHSERPNIWDVRCLGILKGPAKL